MGRDRFELSTYGLRVRCSTSWANDPDCSDLTRWTATIIPWKHHCCQPSSCNWAAILLKNYFASSEGRPLPGGYSIKLRSLSKYNRDPHTVCCIQTYWSFDTPSATRWNLQPYNSGHEGIDKAIYSSQHIELNYVIIMANAFQTCILQPDEEE